MEIKSIYEIKCEILLRSLELVNDYMRNIELGEERRFTVEDEQRCYDEMSILVDNIDILNTFIEILSESMDKERTRRTRRTREELIDLQHKYMNLARKEIGNKPLNFSKVSRNDFLLIRKNKFDKGE